MNRFCTMLLVASWLLPTTAQAYRFKRTVGGSALHWAAGSEVIYELHRAGVDDVQDGSGLDAVRDAFSAWSGVEGMSVRLTYGGATDSKDAGYDPANPDDNSNIVAWIEHDWPFDQAALAVTLSVFRTDTGEMLDSDILFNGAGYSWKTPSSGGLGHDVQNAATHEIGHFLGISHSVQVPDSTMYPGTSAGELIKRTLHSDDLAAIRALYDRDDATPPAQIEDSAPTAEFPEVERGDGADATSASDDEDKEVHVDVPPATVADRNSGAFKPAAIGVPAGETEVFTAGCSTALSAGGPTGSGRNRGSVAVMAFILAGLGVSRRRRERSSSEEDQS